MDHAEEQRSEIEALEAIYPNEFKLLNEDPYTFTIMIKSENVNEGEGYGCGLKFTFTPKYPETVPNIEVFENEDDDTVNAPDSSDLELLQEQLEEQAQENTGMGMVFTLVSFTLEWLNSQWDAMIRERDAVEERQRLEEEEAEKKRFEGTRVTVQSFIEWKTKFDEEMSKTRKLTEAEKHKELIGNKLTGRELFMQDKTLNESDLQFLEDGTDAMPIDESLFEDIDDLDLEDDESGEED